ncbi:MAG TPA: hypothetical protein VN616_07985 [Puia sp.]|nr:hypothetical protein [Puia sp.]
MKPSLLILSLFVVNVLTANCQEKPELDSSSKEAINMIEHYGGFYYESETSTVGQYYLKFSHALSTKELVDLTTNWNPATRCYAFFALSEKHSALLDSILLTHLQDTANVFIVLGDVGDHQTVGDFFYNVVTGQLLGGIDQNSPEKRRLDSLMLFRPGVLIKEKHDLLKTFRFKESWMPRIREIALTEKNSVAVVTLSKYRDPIAFPLIKNLLKDPDPQVQYLGLFAVRNWPDSGFFPYIKKILETQIGAAASYNDWQLRVLYQDIALCKDSISRELMLRALKNIKDWKLMHHSFAIWVALHKYPDPIYTPVLQRLKIKSEHLDGLQALIYENDDWDY